MTTANRYQVGLATKLAYGIGALSDSIKTFSFTTFLLFYYTTVLGLPSTLLGLAMSVGLVWDAAVDPFIGHASDRATLGFGRRHSFMLAGGVCAGVSFIAVFNPPAGLTSGPLFAWLMISSLCLRSSISLFLIPYYALGAELTSDYHERTSISGFRAAAVLAGTLLATAVAFLVYLPSESASGGDAKFAPGSYASMGVTFGIAMIVAGLIATLGTLRERPRLAASSREASSAPGVRRAILEPLRDPSFRVLFTSSSLSLMAAAINAALGMHFLTYHAGIAANEVMSLYFGAFYAGAMIGVFVWVRVAHSFEKQHVYAATLMVTAVVISAGYWIVGEGRPFGTGHLPALVTLNALVGFFGIGSAVIAPSMMADITAQDELRTGRRRDGAFFGVYSFGQQLSSGLAILIAGVLVDQFAGLVAAQAQQSAATIERLVIVSNLLPALIFAAAAVVALRYRLTRRDVQDTDAEIAVHTTTIEPAEDCYGERYV